MLRKGKLCFSSISPSGIQTETNQPSLSVTTSETDNNAGVSAGKGSESSETNQGKAGKVGENELPNDEQSAVSAAEADVNNSTLVAQKDALPVHKDFAKYRNNEAGTIAMVSGDGERGYVVRYFQDDADVEAGISIGEATMTPQEFKEKLDNGNLTIVDATTTTLSKDGVDDGYKDNQGNPLNADGTLKVDKVKSVDDLTDEDFTSPTRNVQLPELPKKVDEAIGIGGKPVVIKKNIFEKNRNSHKELSAGDCREILKNALFNPNLMGNNQPIRRPDYKVLINTGEKNSVVVLDIYKGKDNVEIVGWRRVDEKGLKKMKKQAEREGGQILILSPDKGSAAALSALPLDVSSFGKGSETSVDLQEKIDKLHEIEKRLCELRKYWEENGFYGQIDYSKERRKVIIEMDSIIDSLDEQELQEVVKNFTGDARNSAQYRLEQIEIEKKREEEVLGRCEGRERKE